MRTPSSRRTAAALGLLGLLGCTPRHAGLAASAAEPAPGLVASPAPEAAVAVPEAPAGPGAAVADPLRFDPAAFRAPAGWDARTWGAWPGVEVFRARWTQEAARVAPVRLARGRVAVGGQGVDGVVLTLTPGRGGDHALEILYTDGDPAGWGAPPLGEGWRLTAGSLDNATALTFERDGTTLELTVESLSAAHPPDPGLFADWIYARTLLDLDGPPYDDDVPVVAAARPIAAELERAQAQGQQLDRIRELVAEGIHPWELGWELAADLAEQAGDVELAHAIHRRHRPVGRCSRDDRPAAVARAYADFCRRNRRLGCFLSLQVRLMDDRFDRVAYSSMAERANRTGADVLAAIGLDPDRFLRGLLAELADDGRGSPIGLWRLARAIGEAGRASTLEPALRQLASDPALDEYHRLRATAVLAYLALQDGAAPERLAALPLSPLSRRWLESLAAE
jgi:hypothetical protein